MAGAKAEVLAFAAFLRAHWQNACSIVTAVLVTGEDVGVPGMTPLASAIRLVGAILADLHDEWQASDRRYLSEDSMSLLYPQRDSLATAELTAGN